MTNTYIYNAFIAPDEEFGGNPATVALEADKLSEQEKDVIIKEATTKDVVFVLKPSKARADYLLEFFTSGKENLICGHATVSAFTCMKDKGLIEDGNFTVELSNGNIVYASHNKGITYLEQEHPIYEEPSMEDIAAVLDATGVSFSDILTNTMPMVVKTSNRSLIVGLKTMDSLKNITPNFAKLTEISHKLDIVGFMFFSPETINEKNDFSTRVFAPAVGINEDSASGTIAGALGCYIYDLQEAEKDTFYIEQGYLMEPRRPSFVTVHMQTEERKFLGPRVGGIAKKACD